MGARDIQDLLASEPFSAFVIHTTEFGDVTVARPEQVTVYDKGLEIAQVEAGDVENRLLVAYGKIISITVQPPG